MVYDGIRRDRVWDDHEKRSCVISRALIIDQSVETDTYQKTWGNLDDKVGDDRSVGSNAATRSSQTEKKEALICTITSSYHVVGNTMTDAYSLQ